MNRSAAYLKLHSTGELGSRVEKARTILKKCHLCPHQCEVDRLSGKRGKCSVTNQVMISSFGPHFGEEAPLVGNHGSGTIFFTYCNLKCIYCQNYTISQLGEGYPVSTEELVSVMLSLQEKGCHNINLVSPTHVVPYILEALEAAAGKGLNLPLVYNTGGYDSQEILNLLDGIIDIYMPDMKYADGNISAQLSGVEDYPEVNRAAIREMHRQVGDLQIDEHGIAWHGLLVRHLVLPDGLSGTQEIVSFLAQEISTNTYLNIMAQYHPCHKAFYVQSLTRRINKHEFNEAISLAREQGLHRLDREELSLRFALG